MTAKEPSLREILRTINRVIAGDKAKEPSEATAAGMDALQKAPTAKAPSAKAPLVTKLTTPLGKAQRNNWLVIALLGLDVVLGATFGLVGHFGLESASISLAGAAMATVGLLLMVCFQLFGREK